MNDKLTGKLTGKFNDNTSNFLVIISMVALAAVLAISLISQMSGLTASSPAAQSATGPDNRAIVAMPALAVQSNGMTSGLAKVYQSPQASSPVTRVIAPHTRVQLLGRSQNGEYFAITNGTNSAEITGWVPVNEISTESVSATTRSLVKVYGAPDDSSPIAGVIAPSHTVTLLGRSSDGRFVAIAGEGYENEMAGWVARSELETATVGAQATSLVKVYRTPDNSSMVVGVFAPAQAMVLSGMNASGNWYAVTGENNQGTTGWVSSAEIKTSPAAADLPVIR